MNVPVLIGHLYQNELNGRIVLAIDDHATYVTIMDTATGERMDVTRYYMAQRYIRLGAQA